MSDAIRVVGMMSGTSMDGIDVAEVVTDGITVQEFGKTAYVPIPKMNAKSAPRDGAVGRIACACGGKIGDRLHARAFAGLDAGSVDLIGFHGQTLAHDPDNRRTLQVGDGVQLARDTGHPVVWDFRSADVALGGQGAPLAPFFILLVRNILGQANLLPS